jgi:hypothetical protein
MSLSLDLAAALQTLVGQTFLPTHTLTVTDAQGLAITVDLISVESLGVACEALRLEVPQLSSATMDHLKTWANGLCGRITYLLETLNPLEIDPQGQQVLIRSNPPDTTTTGQPRYYEVVLSAHGGGRFSLRRFEYDRQTNTRLPVPLRITHEQLAKLVNDLVATLPGP